MAFVRNIIADNWVGTKSNNKESTCRSVDEAIDAVKQLNGKNHTQVVMKGDGRTLIIGGGNDGRYSVVLTEGDDQAFYTLVDPKGNRDIEVTIVTGGQSGAFPGNQSVDLEAAIAAVRHFYNVGEPSPGLTWQVE
jgi:ssDNA-binding replication factor A large subunit